MSKKIKTVEVPVNLLNDLAMIAFDYANPEGPSFHGLPLTAKGIALLAGDKASELLSQQNM